MKVVSSIGKSLNIITETTVLCPGVRKLPFSGEGRARCNVMACIGLITCISNHDNYNYDL